MRTLAKLRVLILILLVVAGGHVLEFSEAVIIHPPSILNVSQSPLEPPPYQSVNITALVGSPRPIDEVTLNCFSSTGINESIRMVLVEGNDTYANFLGTIPPKSEGTVVTYKITVVDSLGFRGESDSETFIVKRDLTAPWFAWWYVAPYGRVRDFPMTISDLENLGEQESRTTITDWTPADVIFNITDSGSGVSGANLKFSNSTEANALPSEMIEMRMSWGDRYNGIWIGIVPAMAVGTNVRFWVESHDFNGNARTSEEDDYWVESEGPPAAWVRVSIEDLDLVARNATIKVSVSAHLPYRSPPGPQPLIVTIYGYRPFRYLAGPQPARKYSARIGFCEDHAPSGFGYSCQLTLTVPFDGDPRMYPFDSYLVPVNVTFWYYPGEGLNGLNPSNLRIDQDYDLDLIQTFDSSIVSNQTEVQTYGREILVSTTFRLVRKPSLIDPVMQSVYAVFFVLGSTVWLPLRRKHLASRLGVYVGLFTFVVALLFTATPILERAGIFGASVPVILLMSLPWSIGAFILGALLFSFAEEDLLLSHNHLRARLDTGLSFILPTIAVGAIMYFQQPIGISGGILGIREVFVPTLLGLYYAAVGRFVVETLSLRTRGRMEFSGTQAT